MTYLEMQTAKQIATDKLIAKMESQVFKAYKQRRDEVLEVLKTNYAKYLVGVPQADYYSTLSLYNRLQTMEKEIKGVYVTLSKESTRAIVAGQTEVFSDAYYRSQFSTTFFADTIGTDIKFQALNPLIQKLSVTGDVSILKDIRDKAMHKIANGMLPPSGVTLTSLLTANDTAGLVKVLRVVKSGLISGESYAKQVVKVKNQFDKNVSNASKVIRTEGNRNLNAGSYLNTVDMREQGVKSRRKWLSTLDSVTRDSHRSLDGVYEDENGLWWIGSDSARYPLDFSDPSNSIGCRCTTIDVVEGLEPQLRRGVDPVTGKSDIASYRDYETWKKNGLK